MNQELDIRNIKFEFDQSVARILYYRYKEFIVPFVIIVACFVLFLTIVLGQFQQLLFAQNEAVVQKEKIAVLKGNLTFLSSLNDQELDTRVRVVSAALPLEKDFGGILNAIGIAASRADVSLGDYEFQIGDLAAKPVSSGSFPSLQLTINLREGLEGTRSFLDKLSETLPISTVSTVQISRGSSAVVLVFYYKPQGAIAINNEVVVKTLSDKENKLYNDVLAAYIQIGSANFSIGPTSSESADILGL